MRDEMVILRRTRPRPMVLRDLSLREWWVGRKVAGAAPLARRQRVGKHGPTTRRTGDGVQGGPGALAPPLPLLGDSRVTR